MKITIIGSGYVGLVAGACIASFGVKVCCLDNDATKIRLLNTGKIHIHEPGLEELVRKNLGNGTLRFSTNPIELKEADILIIAVGTPQTEDGSPNLSYIHSVIDDIVKYCHSNKFIIIKSTVPIGTANMVADVLKRKKPELSFELISNPEFLREGAAVRDFLEPDRIVIGCTSEKARSMVKTLYTPLTSKDVPIVFTNNTTAELIKYSSNSYLAMRIAFINEIADIAELIGANIEEIADGMGYDSRIGRHYLHPGPGYGGSCFPKDTAALAKFAHDQNSPLTIVNAVIASNKSRQDKMATRIAEIVGKPSSVNPIALLGLTFKADTDDIRESPSINIIQHLTTLGYKIKAYDPSNPGGARQALPSTVEIYTDLHKTLTDSAAAVIMTEWNEFKLVPPKTFLTLLTQPIVIDLRNIYSPEVMRNAGIDYFSVGR